MAGEFVGKVVVVTGAGEGKITNRKISIYNGTKNNTFSLIYFHQVWVKH